MYPTTLKTESSEIVAGFHAWRPKREPLKQHVELFALSIAQDAFALLMDPGTAKSYAVVTEMCYLYSIGEINFAFVVAPSGVDDEWQKTHFPENANVAYKAFVWEGLSTDAQKKRLAMFLKSEFVGLKVLIVRIDAFSRNTHIELFKSVIMQRQTYFVLDEGHVIKNPESNRADNFVHGLNRPMDNCGAVPYTFDFKGDRKYTRKVTHFASSAKFRRLLTGTLISKSPLNAWAPYQWLRYGTFKNFFAFKNSHVMQVLETVQGRKYNRPIKPEEIDRVHQLALRMEPSDIAQSMHIPENHVRYILNNPQNRTPYKNMEEIKAVMDEMSYYCRLEDVAQIPVEVSVIVAPMTENQRRVYTELKKDQVADLGDKSLVVTSKIALLTRFSQVASGLFRPTNPRFADKVNWDDDTWENDEDTSDEANKYELELIDEPTNKYIALKALVSGWYDTNAERSTFGRPLVVASRFVAEIELVTRLLKVDFPHLNVEVYYGKTSTMVRSRLKAQFKEGLIDIFVVNPSTAGTGLNLQNGDKLVELSSDYDYMKRKQLHGRLVRIGQTETVKIWKIQSENCVDQHVEEILSHNAELSEYFRTTSVEELL